MQRQPAGACNLLNRGADQTLPPHCPLAPFVPSEKRRRRAARRRTNFLILPDCRSRIPCYTAASRLPALVRRSELQEIPMPDKNTPPSGFQFGLTNLKPVESSKVALTFPHAAKRE